MEKFVAIIFLFSISCSMASFPGFLCPANPGNPRVYAPCHLDCQNQHGATFGNCGDWRIGDFNCYCGPMSSNTINRGSVQCREKSENYQKLCEIDCQCNHASKGGVCFWDQMICGCFGLERNNDFCPLANIDEYAKFSEEMVGKYERLIK